MSKDFDDINGVARCSAKKNHIIDPKPADVFDIVEEKFPDCAAFLQTLIPGETMYIRAAKNKRLAARRWDDGSRSVGEVARLAGCSERTVRRTRQQA